MRCCTGPSKTTPRTRTLPAEPLVLGPEQERRDLHRARRSTSSTCSPAGSAKGESRRAQSGLRPADRDRGACPVHGPLRRRPLVNFYHGFHQTGRMDRQELRLRFRAWRRHALRLGPDSARIHAVVDERQTRDLSDLLPGAPARRDSSPTAARTGAAEAEASEYRRLPEDRASFAGRPGQVTAL